MCVMNNTTFVGFFFIWSTTRHAIIWVQELQKWIQQWTEDKRIFHCDIVNFVGFLKNRIAPYLRILSLNFTYDTSKDSL
jgi:hypothetical protein